MDNIKSEKASSISVEDVVDLLKTDLESGLKNDEIPQRLKLFSFNEFNLKQDDPLWLKYLEKFKEPMILLLLASGFISVLMKQYDDAISITCVNN